MSVPTRRAPGLSAQPPPRRAAKGSADTWCAGRPARGAGARGCHAARTGGRSGGAWTRAAHHRTDGQGPKDAQVRQRGQRVRAGRKRAKVTSLRVLQRRISFFFLSFPFFFQILKRFRVFFLIFFSFFLQATEPESSRSCGDPGRREAAGGATAPFIPARPGRCWSKGASRPGRSRARPLGPGARGGAATRERPGAASGRHSDLWRAEDRSAGTCARPKGRGHLSTGLKTNTPSRNRSHR